MAHFGYVCRRTPIGNQKPHAGSQRARIATGICGFKGGSIRGIGTMPPNLASNYFQENPSGASRMQGNLLVARAELRTALWRRGVVVSGVSRMNEVNTRRARLVPGWVTVFGRVYHLGM